MKNEVSGMGRVVSRDNLATSSTKLCTNLMRVALLSSTRLSVSVFTPYTTHTKDSNSSSNESK